MTYANKQICTLIQIFTFGNLHYILMQGRIDGVAIYCNKLAQNLTFKEYEQNQKTINEKGYILYEINRSNEIQYPERRKYDLKLLQKRIQHYSASELAHEMSEIAFILSSQVGERSKLAMNTMTYETAELSKHDKRSFENLVPWNEIKDLDLQNLSNRKRVKNIFLASYAEYPSQMRQMMFKLKIKEKEWQHWLATKNASNKLLTLRDQIIQRATTSEISLNEFKKLARRVHTNRLFRPTDSWCNNFITRYKLEDYVSFSPFQ